MCVLMNASMKDSTSYDDLIQGLETEGGDYEFISCETVGLPIDWEGKHKIKFLNDNDHTFKLTQLGFLTEMNDDSFVVTCEKPATWCENTRVALTGTVNVNAVKAKCTEGAIEHIGYQCNSDDGRKSFYACGTGGWITAGKGDNGFLNRDDWHDQFGPAHNCVAL